MKKRTVFIIPGPPVRVFKADSTFRQVRSTYTENRGRYRQIIENQVEDKGTAQVPIEAIFTFYIPKTAKYPKRDVSLIQLFRFVNHLALGRIYKKEYMLYRIQLKKEYSDDPHTKIVIRTLNENI